MHPENVAVVERPGMGRGVVASRPIEAGEQVLEFRGSVVRARGAHTLQIGAEEHLEVAEPGRFVNHSCDPNCGITRGRLLVARRPIEEGEEITFDYAMTESEMEPLACGCGAPDCRGTVSGYADLSKQKRREYQGFISDHLLG